MLPAIELPRIDYADMTKVTATDIIASNVGAYRYIVGEPVPIVSDLAHLRVVLRKDGESDRGGNRRGRARRSTAVGRMDDEKGTRDRICAVHRMGYC